MERQLAQVKFSGQDSACRTDDSVCRAGASALAIGQHPIYQADVNAVAALPLPFDKLQHATMLITGATGMIGSFLIDVVMRLNDEKQLDCHVIAMTRSRKTAEERLARHLNSPLLTLFEHDINKPVDAESLPKVDFIIHLASNTHPKAYATDPIGTITANIMGTQNMLDLAAAKASRRLLFASSVEIYGENRGDVELFAEDYLGFIDCNTLRAGYPESKRCGEALCQAYRVQKGVDVVVARLARCYGPTLLQSDTKALSQFLHKAVAGEDIELKSEGHQYFSYCYVADAVSALLTILLNGTDGEAYNVADAANDVRLRDLAAIVASAVGRKVVFSLPSATEQKGFSKATVARLDATRLQSIGWKAAFDIHKGIEHTLYIMRDCEQI